MKNILNETKEHYKSYKAGKHWVYACLTVTTLGLGLLGSTAVAQADTNTSDAAPTADTQQVDATAKAQPAATATLRTTTPAPAKVENSTPAAPVEESPAPATKTPETKAPEAEVPAASKTTVVPEPESTEPAAKASASEQEPTPTPVVKSGVKSATPALKAPATPVADPAADNGTNTGTKASAADPAVNTEADATVKPEVETEADPTTDPNNAVNWMPDPAMRKWVEDTLTESKKLIINGVNQGVIVNDANLYQFVNDSFLLAGGNNQDQPDVTNLKGLERFTNLKGIDVTNPKLTPTGMINFDFAPAMTTFRINNSETANLNWNMPLNDFLATYLPNNTSLHFLSLDNLGLTGDLTGLVKYKDLTMVTLTHNNLTGTLPDLTQSKDMFSLNLSYNQLSGTFDPTNLPSLSTLNISDNNFTGDFPNTGNIGFVAYAQNHFTSGLYHPQDGVSFHYEGWNQDLTTPDYTQGQAQAGINPFVDAGVTVLQDTLTGEMLPAQYSLISFGNEHPASIVYSPTAPTNVKDYTSWAAWADQQTNARSWFKFTINSAGQYKLTPVQALPGGYYVFRVAAYPDQYKYFNYSAFITSKIDEGTASTITVRNVDQQGNLISQQVLDGKVGDRVTVQADDLANYKLVSDVATVNKVYTDAPQTITFIYASTLGTVKDVAPDGTVLDQRTMTGTIDDSFTANAGTHYGYTLVGEPTVDGTYTEAPQTITFNYTNTKGTVTVKNVDTDGNLLSQKDLTGNVGDAFTTNAEKLYGYTLTGDPTATGTYTEEPQTVTFVYAIAKGTVTVKNVDTDGNLISQKTLTGNVGADFTANAEKIYGYTLTSDPAATGTYTEEPQTVTFVYTIAKGTVTVKNVDTDGNLISQKTLTGNVGADFTANADKIYGYTLTSDPTTTGTYTEDPQTVTFVYAIAKGTVTVKNVDTDGNVLSQKVLTGNVDDAFTASADTTLTGYQVTGPATQTGTYTEDPQTITFTFSKLPAAQGSVLVKNVDTDGNVLSQHTLTGKVGDSFTANADTLTGYQVTGPATQTGTYTAAPQTITFTFAKITTGGGGDIDTPATNGTVIVKNVDANGNVLSQHTLTGKVGDSFTANADTLAGYQVTGPATQTGTYAETPQTITFVFEKVATNGDDGKGDQVAPTPTKPTTPNRPSQGAQPATGNQADRATQPAKANRVTPKPAVMTNGAAAKTTNTATPIAPTHQVTDRTNTVPATKLPQTNDQASVNPLVAGLTLLLATLGLGLNRKRNH
ncbi:MucBP domain-containing protein [Levilactobacillus zymae]|uniref:MucBP domain-containing protein n=1 Tax=Levilactobacillus zymae TaxID=267363 RepID=UPI003FCCBBC3